MIHKATVFWRNSGFVSCTRHRCRPPGYSYGSMSGSSASSGARSQKRSPKSWYSTGIDATCCVSLSETWGVSLFFYFIPFHNNRSAVLQEDQSSLVAFVLWHVWKFPHVVRLVQGSPLITAPVMIKYVTFNLYLPSFSTACPPPLPNLRGNFSPNLVSVLRTATFKIHHSTKANHHPQSAHSVSVLKRVDHILGVQ